MIINLLNNHARNGVRVSQYSKFILLGALAFLCLAIVSLCVFNNLNALATNNIAFAEEPERGYVTNTGYCPDNYLPNNWCEDWSYNVTQSSNNISNATEFWSDDNWSYRIYNGSLIGNHLSQNAHLILYVKTAFSMSQSYCHWQIGCSTSYTIQNVSVFYYLNSNTSSSWMSNVSNSYNWGGSSKNTSNDKTYQVGSYIDIWTASPNGLYLRFICLQNSSIAQQSGYVPPSYSYYGYDQGYQDGVNAGGSSSDPEFPYEDGIVRDNLEYNSYWVDKDYDLSNNDSENPTEVFKKDLTNNNYYLQSLYVASLIDNVLSFGNYNYSGVRLLWGTEVSSRTDITYTFTLYADNVSHDNTIILQALGVQDAQLYVQDGLNTLTFTTASNTPAITIRCPNGTGESLQILWFKLEVGSYFSGYVKDNYSHNGYDEGYDLGHTEGYSEGYDLGHTEGYYEGLDESNIGYNFIGDLFHIGASTFTFDGKTYFASSAEEDSINIDGVRYSANYFNTQGDPNVFLGLALDYIFYQKVKFTTILYGTDARWAQVGFNLLFCNLDDNTSFTITRSDTQYYSILNTLRVSNDSTYGSMYVVQFEYDLPTNAGYRLVFVPIENSIREENERSLRSNFYDDATMLIWDNTYFFAITEAGLSQMTIQQYIDEAYADGQRAGKNQGYSEGFDRGQAVGYTSGYNDGVDGRQFTFLSLFSSVIDAPISAFNGLFNFDILGVNMRAFLLSILTLAIALFIWKIIVKGG